MQMIAVLAVVVNTCFACSHVTGQEQGAEASDMGSDTQQANMDGSDGTDGTESSAMHHSDTERETSLCDGLENAACMDSDDVCGLMYVLPAGKIDGSDHLWAGCGGDLNFGCTSLTNCLDQVVALDPAGECWWMPGGCLPDEPGWIPAIDDDDCKPPVLVHSCIE